MKEKGSITSWPSLVKQNTNESGGETKLINLNESDSNKVIFKRAVKKREPLTEREKDDQEDKILLSNKIDLDLFNNDLSVIPREQQNESTTSISCKGSEMKVRLFHN